MSPTEENVSLRLNSSAILSNRRHSATSRILSDYRRAHHDLEAALNGCCVKLSEDLVEQVLKRCCNLWLSAYRFFVWAGKQPGYNHSGESCTVMVDILGKVRQFDTIWDLLIKMNNQGLPIPRKIFTIVVKRYARAQLAQEAIHAFRRMRDFGCEPVIEDFNALLSALCKNKLVSHAHEIYDEVGVTFPSDMRTYNILIKSWGEIGDGAQALRVFHEMAERNCEPDIAIYNTLLESLCQILHDGQS
ncbi:hypothetical protein SUGI_0549100 [Cryptomeria japonica]|nr:hypothetical protein SUGI_0549100 [Cryptomeria japonica]